MEIGEGFLKHVEGIDPQLEVRDLGPGLWIWRVLHPGWTEDADWQPVVTCTCVDLGDERLLLDPLVPPPDASPVWDRLDARPPTAVVVLIPDHVRPTWQAPAVLEAAKRAGNRIEFRLLPRGRAILEGQVLVHVRGVGPYVPRSRLVDRS